MPIDYPVQGSETAPGWWQMSPTLRPLLRTQIIRERGTNEPPTVACTTISQGLTITGVWLSICWQWEGNRSPDHMGSRNRYHAFYSPCCWVHLAPSVSTWCHQSSLPQAWAVLRARNCFRSNRIGRQHRSVDGPAARAAVAGRCGSRTYWCSLGSESLCQDAGVN